MHVGKFTLQLLYCAQAFYSTQQRAVVVGCTKVCGKCANITELHNTFVQPLRHVLACTCTCTYIVSPCLRFSLNTPTHSHYHTHPPTPTHTHTCTPTHTHTLTLPHSHSHTPTLSHPHSHHTPLLDIVSQLLCSCCLCLQVLNKHFKSMVTFTLWERKTKMLHIHVFHILFPSDSH